VFNRLPLRSITALLLLGLTVIPIELAHSQAARGAISREARDPSAAMIPDAQIKLIEIRTNQEFGTITSAGDLRVIQFAHKVIF
jgi:hypothetical protein